MPISVLYVHACGRFNGSARSLIEMIQALSDGRVQARVITQSGEIVEHFRRAGAEVIECRGISQFDNTEYGYYRGRRWLVLLREIYFLLPTLLALLRAKKRWKDVAVVHVNEITALIPIVLTKLIFRRPVIVHARSVQQGATRWRSAGIRGILRHFANQIIAIDQTVEASLPAGLQVCVVHNGFFHSGSRKDPPPELGPPKEGTIRVALVGNLLPMKGVYDFLQAGALCKQRGLPAELIIVGHNRRELNGICGALLKRLDFSRDLQSEIRDFIHAYDLGRYIRMLGFVADIASVYDNIDVVCFPSHLNAIGRPVLEASFSGVPSIVAIADPRPDTLIDGVTGICIPARNPAALADAIEYLHRNPSELKRMGEAARAFASQRLSIDDTAKGIFGVYQQQISRESPQRVAVAEG